MNLEINYQERRILLKALDALEDLSTDTNEVDEIFKLYTKVEQIKPTDLTVVVMVEEGRFFVEGEEVGLGDII